MIVGGLAELFSGSISMGVRGPMWDSALYGAYIMPNDEMRRRYRGVRVMYGVDENISHHMGFARDVAPTLRTENYSGAANGLVKRAVFAMQDT